MTLITKEKDLQSYFHRYNASIYGDNNWVFRGQGSPNWNIQPSFLRHNVLDGYLVDSFSSLYSAHDLRIKDFFSNVEEHRLAFFSQKKYLGCDSVSKTFSFNQQVNPPLLDQLALAQHYGLQTLLVDWTHKPLKALWFAINQWVWEDDLNNIVLWMINSDHSILSKGIHVQLNINENFFATIEIVEESSIAKGLNKHSDVQEGCFSITRVWPRQEGGVNYLELMNRKENLDKILPYFKVDYLLLNKKINQLPENLKPFGIDDHERIKDTNNLIRKIEIDKKLLPYIMKVLDSEIGEKGLYPSLGGIAENVKFRHALDNKLKRIK